MDSYPSKLLLLGEYTIINNSSALAMPYARYQSYWSDIIIDNLSDEHFMEEEVSRNSLYELFEDIKKLKFPKLHLLKMKTDLDRGLWICSNSPIGYGMGSSGAVTAAIYDRYAIKKARNLEQLKKSLARIEHSFHGKSSGIDPLVSYTQSPLWIHADKSIEQVSLPKRGDKNKGAIFLVDSHQARVSTPLINFFVTQCKEEAFLNDFVHPVSAAVERAIPALIKEDYSSLLQAVQLISELQFMHLPPMIPQEVQNLWMLGIESQDFYLKICGAGGGGFVLGFTENWEATQQHLIDYDYELLM